MIQRGSTKSGPIRDEAQAHEVAPVVRSGHATRSEEWRDPEPPGEDQPQVRRSGEQPRAGGVPRGMTEGDVEGRSELARYLGKEIYPATGEAIVVHAARSHAPDRVIEALKGLEAAHEYANLQEVWSALGGGVEQRRQ